MYFHDFFLIGNINLRDAAKVGMATDRIVAAAQANATVSRAQGQAMRTVVLGMSKMRYSFYCVVARRASCGCCARAVYIG